MWLWTTEQQHQHQHQVRLTGDYLTRWFEDMARQDAVPIPPGREKKAVETDAPFSV
jgi:hypothetical protein